MSREALFAMLFVPLYVGLPLATFYPQLFPYVLAYIWLMPLLAWLVGRRRKRKN